MQTETSVQIRHAVGLGRESDRYGGPVIVVGRFGVRHEHIQAVDSTAQKDEDQPWPWFGHARCP